MREEVAGERIGHGIIIIWATHSNCCSRLRGLREEGKLKAVQPDSSSNINIDSFSHFNSATRKSISVGHHEHLDCGLMLVLA